jgi:hypothetical protein
LLLFSSMRVDDSPNVRKVPYDGDGSQAYIVRVPDGFSGVQQFAVTIQGRQFLVKCPTNVAIGTKVRSVPHVPPAKKMPLDSPYERQADSNGNGPHIYVAAIPGGVLGGRQFVVTVQGQKLPVTSPANAVAGSNVRIVPPLLPLDSPNARQVDSGGKERPAYIATIPDGVLGGQHFIVTIQGHKLLLACPANARPGNKVQIIPPLPPDSPNVQEVESDDKERPAYIVMIPGGVLGGQKFVVTIQGWKLRVTSPPSAVTGTKVRNVPPLALSNGTRQPQQVLCIHL